MAQYSDTHKQRQPESHEPHKSEQSDADFTRKLREFYDDTPLDLPSFAELVGRGTNTVAKWLGERTCSTWPIKAELPSPSERAEILARLAERVAEVRQLLECIRKSLNWLRDRRFSYEWVWKFFDWKGVELDLLPADLLRDAALYKLERLRCKMKPERPEDRFSLQSLREINFRLLGYINRNKDLPGFSPDKLDAICKAAGCSLAELARMVDRNVVARIDRAYRIDFYPEDCLEPFCYDDVFKTPPVTAEYLSKVMYDDRKAKAINPEVWRAILDWAEEAAKEEQWEKPREAWKEAWEKVWETGNRFGLEQSSAGCSYSFPSKAEGADEAAQEGAALPEGQEQAGSNTAPSDSDSPGRQKRRRSAALATRKALVSSISDYLEKVGHIKLLNRARNGDKEARRLLRQAAAVLRLYRKGKLTAGQTIEKLWRIRFITPEHLGKRGIQNILADLLPCAKSTVCGSRVLSAICAEVKSDGARRYSENAQNYDSFRQDDR